MRGRCPLPLPHLARCAYAVNLTAEMTAPSHLAQRERYCHRVSCLAACPPPCLPCLSCLPGLPRPCPHASVDLSVPVRPRPSPSVPVRPRPSLRLLRASPPACPPVRLPVTAARSPGRCFRPTGRPCDLQRLDLDVRRLHPILGSQQAAGIYTPATEDQVPRFYARRAMCMGCLRGLCAWYGSPPVALHPRPSPSPSVPLLPHAITNSHSNNKDNNNNKIDHNKINKHTM